MEEMEMIREAVGEMAINEGKGKSEMEGHANGYIRRMDNQHWISIISLSLRYICDVRRCSQSETCKLSVPLRVWRLDGFNTLTGGDVKYFSSTCVIRQLHKLWVSDSCADGAGRRGRHHSEQGRPVCPLCWTGDRTGERQTETEGWLTGRMGEKAGGRRRFQAPSYLAAGGGEEAGKTEFEEETRRQSAHVWRRKERKERGRQEERRSWRSSYVEGKTDKITAGAPQEDTGCGVVGR